jgi:DnaJ domain
LRRTCGHKPAIFERVRGTEVEPSSEINMIGHALQSRRRAIGRPVDHYGVLGVRLTAGPADIKSAYRGLAKQCHPDRNSGDPVAAMRFLEVNRAYRILSNSRLRELYDQRLADRRAERRRQTALRAVTAVATLLASAGLTFHVMTAGFGGRDGLNSRAAGMDGGMPPQTEPSSNTAPRMTAQTERASEIRKEQPVTTAILPAAVRARPGAPGVSHGQSGPLISDPEGVASIAAAPVVAEVARQPAAPTRLAALHVVAPVPDRHVMDALSAPPARMPVAKVRPDPGYAAKPPAAPAGGPPVRLAAPETADKAVASEKPAAPAMPVQWTRFNGPELALALSYPTDVFRAAMPGLARDGERLFVSNDGKAVLRVFTRRAAARTSVAAYRQMLEGSRYLGATFSAASQSEFALTLSGAVRSERFHERASLSCDRQSISGWLMVYPASDKEYYETILARMIESGEGKRTAAASCGGEKTVRTGPARAAHKTS